MLEAEETCRIYHRQPWSKEVNEVMTTANILRIHMSSLKNNIDCTKQIKQKQSLLKKQIKLPQDIKRSNNSTNNSTEKLQKTNKRKQNQENINRRRTRGSVR
jgi:hypothetical protein